MACLAPSCFQGLDHESVTLALPGAGKFELHCIVSCPDPRSGQVCSAASVLDRQAADGRWAVAPAVEQERAFARAPNRELASLAPCFLREIVLGAGEAPVQSWTRALGLLSLTSLNLILTRVRTGTTIPKTDAMFARFSPQFQLQAPCATQLWLQADTLTTPGRSVRRFLNPEGASSLSGVLEWRCKC